MNHRLQAFCQPVLWAKIALLLFLFAFLAWPFIPSRFAFLKNLALFFHGIGICICLYCIFFFPQLLIISIPFTIIGIGFFGLAPLIFLIQICYRFFRDKTFFGQISFMGGVALLFTFQLYFTLQYKSIGNDIEQIPLAQRNISTLATYLPRNYMSERLAGTHFRYHTSYCPYDGWRPPLHDPFLVVSRWFFPNVDASLHFLQLEERIDLYRKMFPDRNAYADCYCADFNGDAQGYPRNVK